MAKQKQVSQLGDLLQDVLRGVKKSHRPSLEEIREIWRRVAGEKASAHSWPRRLERGRLVVEAENSGWIYALNLRKQQLLRGLVEFMGADLVKNLNIRIGEKKDA